MDLARVFISSTSDDLQECRLAVRRAIEGLDLYAQDMISWAADGMSGVENSLRRVRESDALVLIVAHRYGYVADGESFSVVELEYRAAREAGVPVLAFFLDEKAPWPPEHVEWEARDRLLKFKEAVSRSTTRKIFRTADELAVQVTQALALVVSRHAPPRRVSDEVRGVVREGATPSQLSMEPNVLVEIGQSADGLALLLDVYRAGDLQSGFEMLAASIGPSGDPDVEALMHGIRDSIVQFAQNRWSQHGLHGVAMRDGTTTQLYVSAFALAGPFASVLASMLSAPRHGLVSNDYEGSLISVVRAEHGQASHFQQQALQSTGGSNRYLGVTPSSGELHTVGWRDTKLVEWRPFILESVVETLPSARFQIFVQGEWHSCVLANAPALLADRLTSLENDAWGRYAVHSTIAVSRSDVLKAIVRVAGELYKTAHGRGVIHGDIKPHNVLITSGGPLLIDEFGLPENLPAPGWSPGWSPPEQILGLPLTRSADIYPLGIMVTRALGGTLAGEVRKYRSLGHHAAATTEYEIVYDPTLVLGSQFYANPYAATAWRQLVEKALRFDPDNRHASLAEFADELATTVERFPPTGELTANIGGDLIAARLAGTGTTFARAIIDAGGMPPKRRSPHSLHSMVSKADSTIPP